MRIVVEFFGVPRRRTGVAVAEFEFDQPALDVAAVITQLCQRYPDLDGTCFQGAWLVDGYTLNLNGDRFLSSQLDVLTDNDHLLLMSADAGG